MAASNDGIEQADQPAAKTPPPRRYRSMWTRIAFGWILIAAISLSVFWWPRRGCWGMLCRGAHLMSDGNSRTLDFANSLPPFCAPLRMLIAARPSWFLFDDEVSYVILPIHTTSDSWISSAKRFPRLKYFRAPARTVTPRLAELRHLYKLRIIALDNADAKTRLSALLALPQVDRLELWSAGDAPTELARLCDTPHLRNLFMENPEHPSVMLEHLAGCEMIEELDIRHAHESSSAYLPHLISFWNLKHLRLACPLTNEDLGTISRVKSLVVLELFFSDEPSPITPDGWKQLAKLSNLNHFRYSDDPVRPAFTPEEAAQIPLILKQCQVTHGSHATMRMIPPK